MSTHQIPGESPSCAVLPADAEPRGISGVVIRPIRLPEERDLFAGLSVATFTPSAPWEATRGFWADYITGLPHFRPGQWLGAFAGKEYLGGVSAYRRVLRVGNASVPTACIANLAVRPEHRGRGIGAALIRAAEALAGRRGDALVLLHGIPGFYRKLGYADVVDLGMLRVTREALDSVGVQDDLPIRPATPGDAPTLLRLFERHFGERVGGFDRDLLIQRYFLEWRMRDGCPIVACDATGSIRGYLIFDWSRKGWGINEAVAEDWSSALALLRHLASEQDARCLANADIELPCPPDSTLAMAIADNIQAIYETEHDADAGWMAKPIDSQTLCDALAPELTSRWRAAPRPAEMAVLTIDGAALSLGVHPTGDRGAAAAVATITGSDVVQLMFGYRPASWVSARHRGGVDGAGVTALSTLFPSVSAWIAGTDAF